MKVHDLSSATKLFQIVKRSNLLMRARCMFFIIDFFLCLFMKSPRKKSDSKKKILILCFTGMGDAVMFFRLSNKIKALFPADTYETVWLCNDVHKELFKQFFDNVLPLPLYKMSFNLLARFRILKILHQEYYDMVLDPGGCTDFTPNIFIARSVVSPVKIGLCPGILDCGRREKHYPEWLRTRIYTKIVTVNETCRHLFDIIDSFFETAAERKVPADIKEPVFAQQKVPGLPEKYYVICPAGSHVRNIWPLERYVELINNVYKKYALPVVLVGVSDDAAFCYEIQNKVSQDTIVINLSGKTSFHELIWLLVHAIFVLSIDTGTYHLARAVGAETFVIADHAHFHLYLKYTSENANVRFIEAKSPACMDCAHCCKYGGRGAYPCVTAISVEEVFNAVTTIGVGLK